MDGKKFKIGKADTDSESLLSLFAYVFDKLKAEQAVDGFHVQQLTILTWINDPKFPPLADLDRALQSTVPPPKHAWPTQLVEHEMWQRLKEGPFQKALNESLQSAPIFGVTSETEILRILAAIAQSFGSANREFKEWNEKVYQENIQKARGIYRVAQQQRQASHTDAIKTSPGVQSGQTLGPIPRTSPAIDPPTKSLPALEPPAIKKVLVERPKEWPYETVGATYQWIAQGSLNLWHASHVGPTYAEKGENQDATFAVKDGNRVLFALADGVSTSYGSRFSAISIVRVFCNKLQELLSNEVRPSHDLLKRAALETHDWLDTALNFLIANPEAPEWEKFRGESKMRNEVAIKFCENTLTLKDRFWGPVMASTLLGGVVQPSEDRRSFEMLALRVGDGLIESIENFSGDESARPLLAMDAQETEISASLSPGPLGKNSLTSIEIIDHRITPGETILISSDGLARGHKNSVAQELRKISGKSVNFSPSRDHAEALKILDKAAKFADAEFKRDPQVSLFGDNLSLIVISNAQSHGVNGGRR